MTEDSYGDTMSDTSVELSDIFIDKTIRFIYRPARWVVESDGRRWLTHVGESLSDSIFYDWVSAKVAVDRFNEDPELPSDWFVLEERVETSHRQVNINPLDFK